MAEIDKVPAFRPGQRVIPASSLEGMRRQIKENVRPLRGDPQHSSYYPFQNTDTEDIAHGEPGVPDNLGSGDGLTDNSELEIKQPDTDALGIVWVNRSADVAEDAYGEAELAGYVPFEAVVNEAGAVGEPYGVQDGTSTFVHWIPGFRMLAYYGAKYGGSVLWGLLVRDNLPCLVKEVDSDYQTCDKDGTASGIDFSADSL